MSQEQRIEVLKFRKQQRLPWHGPPHWEYTGPVTFLVTAACYEHAPIIGQSVERITTCERELLQICQKMEVMALAWCVLPNHYHLLIRTDRIADFREQLGKFHGRSSYQWNLEDTMRGRKVWHRCVDRAMKSDGHFWASLNYIHHNPVRHGYVTCWQDWPYSSAASFLEKVGREKGVEIWEKYPILHYGEGWDE